MTFSSLPFLCIFLPLTVLVSLCLKDIRKKNVLLLCASLFFYAYGEPVYVFLLIAETFLNYVGAFFLQGRFRKGILTGLVVLDLSFMTVLKYGAMLAEGINAILPLALPVPEVVLPIGISFFTFQGISYVIDVYRGKCAVQRSFFRLLLYISFFPQLIAGPIVKYGDIEEQLTHRTQNSEQLTEGILRFIRGLSKKVLIANFVGGAADLAFAQGAALSAPAAWTGSILYLLQIYYDFSGYSDMAIGLGRMFGFRFQENFRQPYRASSIRDFWRRWHISLSSWFRDYLYIPLGGNRHGHLRTALNKFLVFLCTGIWHGANLTFLVWGIYHGLLSMLEEALPALRSKSKNPDTANFFSERLENTDPAIRQKSDDSVTCISEKNGIASPGMPFQNDFAVVCSSGRFRKTPDVQPQKRSLCKDILRHIYTLLCVTLGFVIFRADSLTTAGDYLRILFTGFHLTSAEKILFFSMLTRANLLAAAAGILLCLPIADRICEKIPAMVKKIAGLLLYILCLLLLSGGTYNPFIYFQF